MALQSSVDPGIPPLKPFFAGPSEESEYGEALIKSLKMIPHTEGGYYAETDRDSLRIPNPFGPASGPFAAHGADDHRNASTTIFYLLTRSKPLGVFHRNKARTVHTLHKGRGRYVIIHADEVASKRHPGGYADESEPEASMWTGKARIETFVVGQNVLAGEKLQWIVEGGKYKSSFLLPDEDGSTSEGLLISETVVPGFEFRDHDFMRADRLKALVTAMQANELKWMLSLAE